MRKAPSVVPNIVPAAAISGGPMPKHPGMSLTVILSQVDAVPTLNAQSPVTECLLKVVSANPSKSGWATAICAKRTRPIKAADELDGSSNEPLVVGGFEDRAFRPEVPHGYGVVNGPAISVVDRC